MLIRDNRPTINFMDCYRPHYGGLEDVVIEKLDSPAGPEPYVRLQLGCRRPDFCSFRFSENAKSFYHALDNTFHIRPGTSKKWEGKAQPVYQSGPGPVTYAIAVTFKTRADYRAEGIDHGDLINVAITPPLEFGVREPESWLTPRPTEEERRFAEATWGRHVAGVSDDYGKARALAKALCHELWPHSGKAPIPEMQWYSPFEMYRAMMEGRSDGFCTQFGMIFSHACKCFGVISRNLHIERPVAYGADRWLMIQGMHCFSEIFDRALNRWIFMDLRFYCLGAYLGEEGPLNLAEFHLFMCQPHYRNRLRFHVYDMATGTEKRVPMDECPRPDIHFYGQWHSVFHVGYN
jgi:hypothetical protein